MEIATLVEMIENYDRMARELADARRHLEKLTTDFGKKRGISGLSVDRLRARILSMRELGVDFK